jgi:hypothetical protein
LRGATHLVHLGRDCGREEEGLTGDNVALGKAVDDPDNLLPETLLQQTIGLVEDERTEVGELGLEVRVLQVVDHASGSRDKDVAALLVEARRLGFHVGSSDNVLDAVVGSRQERAGSNLNLDRQLPRGLRRMGKFEFKTRFGGRTERMRIEI